MKHLIRILVGLTGASLVVIGAVSLLPSPQRRAWNACEDRLRERVPFPAYADSFVTGPRGDGSFLVWGPYPEAFTCEVQGDSVVRFMIARE